MKKYIIKPAKGGEVPVYFKNKKFNTTQEASDEIIYLARKYYLNVFDFKLEGIEAAEHIDNGIINFDAACEYLHLGASEISPVVAKQITNLVENINPAHVEALSALNELFTIAEAWNKQDGFVPDFSKENQDKYVPVFYYDSETNSFVYVDVRETTTFSYVGSRLCFKSKERASQFGNMFLSLYNDVFLPYYL